MSGQRRGFSALRELRFRLEWVWSELGAILGILAIFVLLVPVLWHFGKTRPEPAVPEFGTVVHFGVSESKYDPKPAVVVRTKDGFERQLAVSTRSTLVHCRKGSLIRLVRKGSALFVDKRGCGQVAGEPTVPEG